MTRLISLKIVQLLSFILLISSFNQAYANKQWRHNGSSPVSIDIIDDSGRYLKQYTADSNGYKTQRTYLEAKKGKRYQLHIRNNSNRRVGVVVAVDGRNILSGKKSYLRSNEKMYVLDPYESASYKGWRTSKNRVNRFYFTSAGNSYANAWGDRSAMGVIAVAVFDEKPRYYNKKYRKGFSGRPAPSQRGYLREDSTGTGFGREEYSPTIRVNFKAKSHPTFKHFLKYEWRSTLCKRGVIRCNSYESRPQHNRFWPKEARHNDGFAPYPPNYRKSDWSDQFTRSWNSDNYTIGWDTDYNRGW